MTMFGATVREAGGGLVQLVVDRDTKQYPGLGDHVIVEVDEPEVERDWRYFSEALSWYPGRSLTGGEVFSVVQQIKQALFDGRITPADLGIKGRTDHG